MFGAASAPSWKVEPMWYRNSLLKKLFPLLGMEFDSPTFRHKKLEDCYKPIGIFVMLLSDSGIPLAWYARYASSILASSTILGD